LARALAAERVLVGTTRAVKVVRRKGSRRAG
jgi:hypothetical protein